ncbi:MAG TPA: PD-(D/E)XK nuclease family protein, partial [Candidatus Glassbacteria bacterium]|nr:PD-(D/E)XK nuclease family protein [Candidatus Glassbacteria bacterium]
YEKKLTKEQIDEGYGIMKLYLHQLLDKGTLPQIVAVERKIWEPVDGELNFIGYIDRLQKDDDGIIHVMDYKTTKNKRYLKDRTQLILYAYFTYLKNPDIDKIRSSFILLRHKNALMTEEHSVAELINTKDKFVKSWQEIKEEKLFRPNSRYDTCTICDYSDRCMEGRELLQRRKTFHGQEAGW